MIVDRHAGHLLCCRLLRLRAARVPQPRGGRGRRRAAAPRPEHRIQIALGRGHHGDRALPRRLRHLRAAPERRRRRPGPDPIVPSRRGTRSVDVQVIGQQWEFTYRYPTYGGRRDVAARAPGEHADRLHVTSLDVVHSFWAYQLGVKADANPGRRQRRLRRDEGAAHVRASTAPSSAGSGTATCSTPARSSRRRVRRVGQAAAGRTSRRSASTCRPYSTTYLPDPQRRAG